MGWQTPVPIKGVAVLVGGFGMCTQPSQRCQLTGPDFPVWRSLVSVGDPGCWETRGGLARAWKPETEYSKQTGTVCVPVSPAHQSDDQGHFITKASSNSGSVFTTFDGGALGRARASGSPGWRNPRVREVRGSPRQASEPRHNHKAVL